MADGPKIAADDATRTRPDRWPDASAMAPGSFVDGPRTGDRVGRYVIEGRLGAGGMGIVALAKDPELSRQVALKVVRPGVGDRAYRQRLVREARAMAQLDHPNVVRVHDAGEADGEVFVAMEYVKGQTLGAWLKAERRPWREVVRRFVEAGRGLVAAHAAGLVHRDFKPDNVLVRDSDGRVAVSDFGLAAPVRDGDAEAVVATMPDPPPADDAPISGDASTVAAATTEPGASAHAVAPISGASTDSPLGADSFTATGAVIGTPSYMAPEQAGGAAIDARADVYSFCVALHEGVYGQRPFTIKPLPGGGFARGPATSKLDDSRAPTALRKIVARGLATDPTDRWPGMEPLLDALERLAGRRTRRLAIALSVVTATALGVGAYLLVAREPTDVCADQAARIATVWGPTQRDATQRALLASNLPYAPQAARAALDSLDQWAQSWRDVRLDACRAAERGVMPDDEAHAREECLDRLLTDSAERVAVLQTASPDVVQRALEIASLANATTCTIGQADPLPHDPVIAHDVAGLRDELAAIDLLVARNRHGDALERLRRIATRAAATGYAPLDDDIGRRVVREEMDTGASTADTATRARLLVERYAQRGQDDVVAALWLALLEIKGAIGSYDGVEETASAARVAALRSRDLTRKLRTEFAIGRLYLGAGRANEANSICASGLASAEGLRGAARIEGLQCLADCALAAATTGLSVEYLSQAFSETLVMYGPKHPTTLEALRRIATAHDHLEHNLAATVIRESLAAVTAVQSGETSVDHGLLLGELSISYLSLGDVARARAVSDRAQQIMAPVLDDDARKINSRSMRAYVLQRAGSAEEALAEWVALADSLQRTRSRNKMRAVVVYNLAGAFGAARCKDTIRYTTHAIDDMEQDLAPTMLIYLEAARAQCHSQLGEWADAARELDARWQHIDPEKLVPDQRGTIEIALANALYHVDDDPDRVLDLFVRGRADLAKTGIPAELAQVDAEIAEVRRWRTRKDAEAKRH